MRETNRSQTFRFVLTVLTALVMTCSSQIVSAETVRVGNLAITQPWSRATPNGAKVASAYLTIENTGTRSDKLVSATSDTAERVEVHEMTMDDGVMKMRELENGLTIGPGQTATLAPGGNHLMLIKLRGPLIKGAVVPILLVFEKAGPVKVSFDVQAIGA